MGAKLGKTNKNYGTDKTMKKLMLILTIALFGALNNLLAASPVDIYTYAVTGPVRANTNAFEAWSVRTVAEARTNNGAPVNALGYKLLPGYVCQSAAQTNNTLWFVIHVVSRDPAYKFLPSKLNFVGGSSDSQNYLSTAASLASDPNFTYSPRFMGILWGNGGQGVNDTVLSSPLDGKISEVPVNETIFIGAQLNYFLADYSSWIMGFPDYSVSGTWSFNDGENTAHSTKTLHTKLIPALPTISLNLGDSAVVGANTGTNSSAVLCSSPQMPPTWKVEGVMNTGDFLTFPKNKSQYYFKLFPL